MLISLHIHAIYVILAVFIQHGKEGKARFLHGASELAGKVSTLSGGGRIRSVPFLQVSDPSWVKKPPVIKSTKITRIFMDFPMEINHPLRAGWDFPMETSISHPSYLQRLGII